MAILTQDQFDVINQSVRNLTLKINLLNFNFQVVDEFSGISLKSNITEDANSDIRRTCSIEMIVDDLSSMKIKSGGKIWLDKYIQIFVGIDNIYSGEITWFNKGIYIIDNPSWNFSDTTQTLSFKGLDLMAKMTGLRNGNLEGLPTEIPAGSNVRSAIIQTITQLGGFSRYIVDECRTGGAIQNVPNTITVDVGGTVYDILKQLRDIIPQYEMFFDVDGVFHYQMIPSGKDEYIYIDDSTLENVLLSETINVDFQSVKNIVEVLGMSLDPIHYSDSTTSGNTYLLTIPDVKEYVDYMIYGFTAHSILSNPYLKINELPSKRVILENGRNAVIPESNQYYVVRYDKNKDAFIFLGHQQTRGMAQDTNPDSPFYINSTIGKIRIVLHGGEYNNVYSDDLCKQRAEWELYQRTRMNDGITLSCVPIYYADVNTIIEHTPHNETEPIKYIIKNISTEISDSGSQQITAIRYYSFYE